MPNPLPRKDRGTFENKRRQIRSESLIAHHSMYWNESHIAHRSISVRAPQNAVFVPHPEARAGRSIARRTQLEGGFEDSCGSRDPTTESLTAHQRRTQKEKSRQGTNAACTPFDPVASDSGLTQGDNAAFRTHFPVLEVPFQQVSLVLISLFEIKEKLQRARKATNTTETALAIR
jgi:hypothetical protein